jgi:hypothetical protein
MLQLWRVEITGDVLLDSQIVEFALVFGEETRHGLGIPHDRASDEIALLAYRCKCS